MERKLYRIPEEGMFAGVCAGLAGYFNTPVLAVRIVTVVLMLFGLFIPVTVVYVIMAFTLEKQPARLSAMGEEIISPDRQLKYVDNVFQSNEQRLRELERYITSDTYRTRNQFNRL